MISRQVLLPVDSKEWNKKFSFKAYIGFSPIAPEIRLLEWTQVVVRGARLLTTKDKSSPYQHLAWQTVLNLSYSFPILLHGKSQLEFITLWIVCFSECWNISKSWLYTWKKIYTYLVQWKLCENSLNNSSFIYIQIKPSVCSLACTSIIQIFWVTHIYSECKLEYNYLHC